MGLPIPRVDDRTFADLVAELLDHVPSHQPEWTNYNPSDPGITLLELFAHLAEMLVYRADQVTDDHRRVFLRLLNGPDWSPDPALGVDELTRATLQALRTPYRAVTAADHEALALAASPDVARAHCVPRRHLGAATEEERTLPRRGDVGVVVLPQRGFTGDLAALRAGVWRFLEPRRLLGTRISVVDPVWAPVTPRVLVARRPEAPPEAVAAAVGTALEAFLDPLSGGRAGAGWPFGRAVYVAETSTAADASRAALAAVRSLLHPLEGGPRGDAAWRLDQPALAGRLGGRLASVAQVTGVAVRGDPPAVGTDADGAVVVTLRPGEVLDARATVTVRRP